jgi:hypothetical protein
MRELQHAHRDDAKARHAAVMGVYREENIKPLHTVGLSLTSQLVMPATALLSPRRQSLISRLAGIAEIVEPPAAARSLPPGPGRAQP